MKVLKTIAVNLFVGANIAVILLMWLSCLATYVNPSAWPKVSLITLAFPIFAATNVAFIVFWLIFKVRRVWIPIVGFLACGSFVRDYLPLNLPSVPAGDSLRILSFNTHGFGGADAYMPDGKNQVAEYIKQCNADIICLQETYGNRHREDFDKEMIALGYEHYSHTNVTLYSKLHILQQDTLSMPTRTNNGFVAYLEYGEDTLMLVNAHFESNHFTRGMREAYVDALEQSAHNAPSRERSDMLRRELRPLLRLLAEAAPYRGAQANSINCLVEQWLPRPVILCSDLNDTPISYAHRVLTHNLTSAFVQSGNGLGFTFHDRGFPVRIDHIFFDAGTWDSHHTHIDDAFMYSDHLPLSTILTRKTPKKR